MSMVCGAVNINFKARRDAAVMPALEMTFRVLTMDRSGHIIFPADYDAISRARLRKQARVLVRRMMDDESNPVDESWLPALTGTGFEVRRPLTHLTVSADAQVA